MGETSAHTGPAVAGDTLLHAALGSMPYGFTVWDEQLRFVLWNDTYLDMYHLPAERVRAGMTLREMAGVSSATGDHGDLPPEEVHEIYLKRFRHDEGARITEHQVRDRVIRSTTTRMSGLGWVVTHQDITDEVTQKRVAEAREEALAQQNMRFGAAVNNMPQGLAMFGPDQRLVICNDMFASMYGLPPDLVRRGVPLHRIVDYRRLHAPTGAGQRDAGYLEQRLTVARQRGRSLRIIENERGRIISVMHQPMPDGGWVSTHQDITEQRAKEDLIQARTLELEIQNIRFDAAINNMLHGLSMFDGDKRLIVCNRQFAELYRMPPHLTRPGTSLWDMLDDREQSGMVSIMDREERTRVIGEFIAAGLPFRRNMKMHNGRVISVLHQPMPGGGWLTTHEDVTEQHQHEETIRHLARHDSLTDLPNRVLFQEEMTKAEARIKRREKIGVLCVDLDHFKAVNDTLGHAVGDLVLVNVAKRLREAARETDVVARLGGDEFAVLVGPLEHPRNAALIAERIVKSVGQPMIVDGRQIMIGASVGIALAPIDGADGETLLKNADLALYRAKSEGRGAYHFFEKGMDDELKNRRLLEFGLKGAMARNEFRLVFQPVIDLAHNRICCVEALLRWDHPERGPIPPAEFIPIAEETGMIVAIGDWVLKEACRAAARWPETIRIAVNLSAMQFRHRGLADSVERALTEADLAPQRLELEITESLLAADSEATLKVLHRLRGMGVKIAIDDFGAGYSSLSYLRSFSFDKVKVDRSFMDQLSGDTDSMAVINAMIGLGRSLGMATTAEGIETEAQLESVRRQGCDEVQGFLFSPPLPASGIDALLGAGDVAVVRRTATA